MSTESSSNRRVRWSWARLECKVFIGDDTKSRQRCAIERARSCDLLRDRMACRTHRVALTFDPNRSGFGQFRCPRRGRVKRGDRSVSGEERSADYGHSRKNSPVNHSREFVTADSVHTQRIESMWRPMRQFFRGRIVAPDRFANHCVEYQWRKYCEHGVDYYLIEAIRDAQLFDIATRSRLRTSADRSDETDDTTAATSVTAADRIVVVFATDGGDGESQFSSTVTTAASPSIECTDGGGRDGSD